MEGFPKMLLWGQILMLDSRSGWLSLLWFIPKVEIRTLFPPNALIQVFMPLVLVHSWVGREGAIPKLLQQSWEQEVVQNVLVGSRVPQQLCGRRLPGCPSQTHPLWYNTTDTWLCNNNNNNNANNLHRRYPVVRYQAGVPGLLRFFLKCLFLPPWSWKSETPKHLNSMIWMGDWILLAI